MEVASVLWKETFYDRKIIVEEKLDESNVLFKANQVLFKASQVLFKASQVLFKASQVLF